MASVFSKEHSVGRRNKVNMNTFIPRCDPQYVFGLSRESHFCDRVDLWWITGTSSADSLRNCCGLVFGFDVCADASGVRSGNCADRGFHCLDAERLAHLNGQRGIAANLASSFTDNDVAYYTSYRGVEAYMRGEFDGESDDRDWSYQDGYLDDVAADLRDELEVIEELGYVEPTGVREILDGEPAAETQPKIVYEATRWNVGVFTVARHHDRFVVRHAHGGLVPVGNGTHAAAVSFASLEAAISRASETMQSYLSGRAA